MIRGWFAARAPEVPPAPWVRVGVRISSTFERVDFLINTGADYSSIHPHDARRLWPEYLGRDFVNDPTGTWFSGISGTARFIRRAVDLRLLDDEHGMSEAHTRSG